MFFFLNFKFHFLFDHLNFIFFQFFNFLYNVTQIIIFLILQEIKRKQKISLTISHL